jgi:HK97 family phage major capsid protein
MSIFDKLAAAKSADEVKAIAQAFTANSKASNSDAIKKAAAAMMGAYDDRAPGDVDSKAVQRPILASPYTVSEQDYKGLYEAVQRKSPTWSIDCTKSFREAAETKAPFGTGSFSSGGLPPVLMPQNTLGLPYEQDRMFEHFIPQKAPEANSVAYLVHSGNANPASAVAELGNKPDLGMAWTEQTVSFTKIAALASFSLEALQDFSHFLQIVPAELFAAVVDAETDQIVNGNGTAPNMTGLLNTSGVLTRAVGSDTVIDALRKSFNDIRVGSAFGHADLVAMHPTTWAAVSLAKATTGAYLLNPNDPNAIGDLDNIFGVRVITNTKIPAGKAIVADTKKAVISWTRMGLTLDINSYGTNEFNENYSTFRAEERIAIGVQRPTALNIVTGLPTS